MFEFVLLLGHITDRRMQPPIGFDASLGSLSTSSIYESMIQVGFLIPRTSRIARVTPEPPQRGGPPGAVERRGKPGEAAPKEKAKPERPQGTPVDNVRSEDREQERGRGIRR